MRVDILQWIMIREWWMDLEHYRGKQDDSRCDEPALGLFEKRLTVSIADILSIIRPPIIYFNVIMKGGSWSTSSTQRMPRGSPYFQPRKRIAEDD